MTNTNQFGCSGKQSLITDLAIDWTGWVSNPGTARYFLFSETSRPALGPIEWVPG
jgi:hypothetical protein